MAVDMITAATISNNTDLPEEVSSQLLAASNELTTELDFVFEHILSPQYSPNHPVGNKMMKDAESHFDKVSDRVTSNLVVRGPEISTTSQAISQDSIDVNTL